jgi:hypothetical protein
LRGRIEKECRNDDNKQADALAVAAIQLLRRPAGGNPECERQREVKQELGIEERHGGLAEPQREAEIAEIRKAKRT